MGFDPRLEGSACPLPCRCSWSRVFASLSVEGSGSAAIQRACTASRSESDISIGALLASGSSARQTELTRDRPVDAVIMAIVDSWDVAGEERYHKGREEAPSG